MSAAPTEAFPFLALDALADLPPLCWTVDQRVPAGGLVLLIAPTGGFKTSVACDVMMSIAGGRGWHGREVTAGRVVLFAGEGVRGLPARLAAHQSHYGHVSSDRVLVVPQAPNLLDPKDVERAHRTVAAIEDVQLVVFDTHARHMHGGDENGAQDTGRMIAAYDRVRGNATGLVLHHTGKDAGKGERGHSSLRGAADTVIRITGTRDKIVLTCTKQKDAEPFDPILLCAVNVGSALVLASHDGAGTPTGSQASVLAAVPRLSRDKAQSYAVIALAAGIGKSTAERATKALIASGHLLHD